VHELYALFLSSLYALFLIYELYALFLSLLYALCLIYERYALFLSSLYALFLISLTHTAGFSGQFFRGQSSSQLMSSQKQR
jgi:hypothetical protein